MEQRILACVDGSGISTAVVDYAAWLGQLSDTPVRLQYNIESNSPALPINLAVGRQNQLLYELDTRYELLQRLRGEHVLSASLQRLRLAGHERSERQIEYASLVQSLMTQGHQARLVVVGAWGCGHESKPLVTRRVQVIARSVRQPLLVVNGDFQVPRSVVVLFDDSPPGLRAIDWVAASPVFDQLDIHLVSIGRPSAAFDEAARRLRIANRIVLPGSLARGPVIASLNAFISQTNCQLLVLGAFRHSRFHDFIFGSFTMQSLRHASVPVLLLH